MLPALILATTAMVVVQTVDKTMSLIDRIKVRKAAKKEKNNVGSW